MDIVFDISIAEVLLAVLVLGQHIRQSLSDRKLTADEVETIFAKVAEVFQSSSSSEENDK
jgi:hypothetical protein